MHDKLELNVAGSVDMLGQVPAMRHINDGVAACV